MSFTELKPADKPFEAGEIKLGEKTVFLFARA